MVPLRVPPRIIEKIRLNPLGELRRSLSEDRHESRQIEAPTAGLVPELIHYPDGVPPERPQQKLVRREDHDSMGSDRPARKVPGVGGADGARSGVEGGGDGVLVVGGRDSHRGNQRLLPGRQSLGESRLHASDPIVGLARRQLDRSS